MNTNLDVFMYGALFAIAGITVYLVIRDKICRLMLNELLEFDFMPVIEQFLKKVPRMRVEKLKRFKECYTLSDEFGYCVLVSRDGDFWTYSIRVDPKNTLDILRCPNNDVALCARTGSLHIFGVELIDENNKTHFTHHKLRDSHHNLKQFVIRVPHYIASDLPPNMYLKALEVHEEIQSMLRENAEVKESSIADIVHDSNMESQQKNDIIN